MAVAALDAPANTSSARTLDKNHRRATADGTTPCSPCGGTGWTTDSDGMRWQCTSCGGQGRIEHN